MTTFLRIIKTTLAAAAAVAVVIGGFGAGVALVNLPHGQPAAAALALPLPQENLEAKAAVVLDLKTGDILYQKDAQEPLPLASITKLMTLQAALSDASLSEPITITSQDLAPDGDWGLHVGDQLSLRDLVALAIVASCNDCAEAVASTMGSDSIDDLNNQARDLNLTRSTFSNPTGLDVNVAQGEAGAYGSAFDVARLTAAFYQAHPELFALTTQPSVSVRDGDRTLTFPATMAPLQDIPGFIGAKTGYTDLAGGNLVAIFDLEPGHPVAAVVLHSSEQGRFTDMRTLIEALRTVTTIQ
jgi:D-alanyl-D-alanine carboxypeptidase (penicillin-binding protein 5/6)